MAGRPSFRTVASLTRWVQRLRVRLQAKSRYPAERDTLPLGKTEDGLPRSKTTGACRTLVSSRQATAHRSLQQPKIPSSSCVCFHCGLEILRRVQAQIEPSLDKVAAPESQSQEHAAQGASQPPEVEQASIVLDVTTLLLDQLLGTTGSWNARWQAAAGYDGKAVDDLNMQKSLAHLKHVLRTMQHLAFVYLLHLSLDSLRWDDRPPRKDWEALKRHLNDWFAEWSGDRPPLNSTMPWNIKPSLVVLWGVCWMYYKNEARPRASRQESAGGWAPAQPVVHGNVDLPGTTMPSYTIPSPVSSNTGMQQAPSATQQSPVPRANANPNVRSDMIGHISDPGNPNVFGSEAMTQPASHMTPYPDPGNPIHLIGGNISYGGASAFSQAPVETASVANTDSHNPNVAAPLTSEASSSSFATASQEWRGHPFSRPYPRISQGSTLRPQQPGNEQDISASTSQFHSSYTDPFAEPYEHFQDFTSNVSASPSPFHQQQPPPYPPVFGPGSNPNIANLGPSAHVGQARPNRYQHLRGRDFGSMHSSQISYPSPHSEASEAPSLRSVSMPETASPQLPQAGPRVSAASRRTSVGHAEPPRNAQDQIYCDHPECAHKPPTFSRKCEWTKHNDKHTRPYVCREPGCEKIRGFTYSGGLLRHQREVHRHYGGPRAPRFCPHRDCKRSSGQGFSRRENLNEHIRRVHRGVGIEGMSAPAAPAAPSTTNVDVESTPAAQRRPSQAGLQTSTTQQPARKRQRIEVEEEDDDEDDDDDDEGFARTNPTTEPQIPPLPSPTPLLREHRIEIQRLRHEVQQLRDETHRLRRELATKDEMIDSMRSMIYPVGGQHGLAQ